MIFIQVPVTKDKDAIGFFLHKKVGQIGVTLTYFCCFSFDLFLQTVKYNTYC